MKRQVPLLLATIIGLVMVADNFFKAPTLNQTAITIRAWVVILATIALALGALNLFRVHYARVIGHARRPGWTNSLVLLAAMIATIVIGLSVGKGSTAYSYLYDGIMTPGSSTAYALLAFFIASAAIRSFRIRSVESTLLLATAIVLMLANAPIGAMISPYIPQLGAWLMKIPSAAAQRGIIITSAIAFIAINLRNILGFSSEWLGGSKD